MGSNVNDPTMVVNDSGVISMSNEAAIDSNSKVEYVPHADEDEDPISRYPASNSLLSVVVIKQDVKSSNCY